MKGYLNKNRIDYIIEHLLRLFDIPEDIATKFCFIEDDFDAFKPNKIYFKLSPSEFNISKVKHIDNIPVLFPLTENKAFFEFKKEYLIFNDDLLKSAFYLLSGYQEIESDKTDSLGRFSFEESLQHKLKITKKPIVNYYFEIIIRGIELFIQSIGLDYKITPKRLFENFGFILSHDVDRIKLYTPNNITYKIKQVLGLVNNPYSFLQAIYLLGLYTFMFINPFSKDPYWNFKELTNFEHGLNIKSVWFFLNKNKKHVDSYYSFKNKKIKKLLRFLISIHHEIGLHGTVEASYNSKHLSYLKSSLAQASDYNVIGIRQHRLSFKMPLSFKIQCDNQFKYDSTMGFPSHEGFRNSFCYPFKPYDFENEASFNIWEVPLNVMDATLFHYRNLSFEEANNSIFEIIDEVKKFGGVFSLLWHNHYFNNHLLPGISEFYKKLIKNICNQYCENILPNEMLTKDYF